MLELWTPSKLPCSNVFAFSSVSYFLPSKIMDEAVNVALTTITSILIFTSIVGNSVVCFVVIRNRDMRTPINCLIVNLAVADVVYSLFLIPMVILMHITSHPDGISGKVLCTLLTDGNLAFVGAACSNITLTAIAFERYYAVIYPHGNKGDLSMRKVKLLVLGSWVFAFVLQLPQLLKKEFNGKINPHRCTSTWSEKWVTRGFFLTCYWAWAEAKGEVIRTRLERHAAAENEQMYVRQEGICRQLRRPFIQREPGDGSFSTPQIRDVIKRTHEGYQDDDTVNKGLLWEMMKLKIREQSIKYATAKKVKMSKHERELEKEIIFLQNFIESNEINPNEKTEISGTLEARKRELEKIIEYRIKGSIVRARCRWYSEGEKIRSIS
ncbi:PREDICTED: orexin receptor type 1-like [Acropora digitifera]|uniref:orexin receptor type 1-like n=1 Tax=Acropora digitifera TaxID=70779 RepID=UPI00077AC30B|nr:PREDICTED: orexin receptor type 1-like [Acropora digitifera]